NVRTFSSTEAFSASSSAATPAESMTRPPVNVVRKASLSSRIRAVLSICSPPQNRNPRIRIPEGEEDACAHCIAGDVLFFPHMESDFDRWNTLKKGIDQTEAAPSFVPQEREVWMCALGRNIGFEQN